MLSAPTFRIRHFHRAGEHRVRKVMTGCPPAGWDGKRDWHVYAAFDDVPASFSSPNSTIVSANNKPKEREYPLARAISRQWIKKLLILPYRFKAIPVQFENGG